MKRILLSKIVTYTTPGLHDLNKEWIELQNVFGQLSLRGWVVWEIEISSGLWRRFYSFPELIMVKGDVLRVHTGQNPKYGGISTKSEGDSGVIHLYANRRHTAWTNPRNRICVANNAYTVEDVREIESILVRARS